VSSAWLAYFECIVILISSTSLIQLFDYLCIHPPSGLCERLDNEWSFHADNALGQALALLMMLDENCYVIVTMQGWSWGGTVANYNISFCSEVLSYFRTLGLEEFRKLNSDA